MRVLVVNAGSSSLKLRLLDGTTPSERSAICRRDLTGSTLAARRKPCKVGVSPTRSVTASCRAAPRSPARFASQTVRGATAAELTDLAPLHQSPEGTEKMIYDKAAALIIRQRNPMIWEQPPDIVRVVTAADRSRSDVLIQRQDALIEREGLALTDLKSLDGELELANEQLRTVAEPEGITGTVIALAISRPWASSSRPF